ncbi:MAG: MFS transporter, partial [Woeseia sp.]
IPAGLASQGVATADIGSYLAVVILPWAFKLVTGPLMDRFEFLPMGRRRPWVLGAQFGLCVSLLALMLVENPTEQMGLMMLIGFLINSFAATQDVAVDGMSIDLTPQREQGRLNAFMSFGKAIGWASTSAVTGITLVTWGLHATAILAAVVSGIIMLLFVFVVERENERHLPWSRGQAAAGHKPGNSFSAVFAGINEVLWLRTSLIVMAIMFFDGLVTGYGQALMPIAAVKVFGFTTPQWSQLVAMMGLAGAVLALALGPMIDRFGARRMLILTASLVGVHALVLAQTQHLWEDTLYVRTMLSIWVLMLPVVMVCVIALAMAICSRKVSATQFAIYMSIANLGAAAGSKTFGMVADRSTYVENYLVLSVFVMVMIVVLYFYRDKSTAADGDSSDRPAPESRAIGIDSTGAGIFWSGAMRCPKCRTDMEQIDYEGTEIDRCTYCQGLWLDAGEAELLKNKKAAAAIDTGDARQDRYVESQDRYQCPRCSAAMVRMVDPQQTHIWFEQCNDCRGVFYDAGEFRDLAAHSISDYFKGLMAPERR